MQESLLMLGAKHIGDGTNPEGQGNFAGRGDLVDGVRFWGEVPTSGFINGTELASATGLTRGTVQHSDAGWLHFELDGKTLYVAKRPFRHSVSWDQIHARGAVFGTRTIELNGLTYKVRLLTGADVDPTPVNFEWDPVGTSDSEWNRLIYSVHNGIHTVSGNTTPPGEWPLYSDTDLIVHSSAGNGSRSWCQETYASNAGIRIFRGHAGVSYLSVDTSSRVATSYGWRPVLELIE